MRHTSGELCEEIEGNSMFEIRDEPTHRVGLGCACVRAKVKEGSRQTRKLLAPGGCPYLPKSIAILRTSQKIYII